MAFEVFLCIGMFRGRKEPFVLPLTLGLGWNLESTYFFNSYTHKKEKKSLLNHQTRGASVKPQFQEGKHGKIQVRHMHEKEEIRTSQKSYVISHSILMA